MFLSSDNIVNSGWKNAEKGAFFVGKIVAITNHWEAL